MDRIHNFNAGPAALPLSVLLQVQNEMLNFRNSGMSIMEHSHRGKVYEAVHNDAIERLRQVMEIPAHYKILFCQGGAHQQFAMVPMNLLQDNETADYILTGMWSQRALEEAQRVKKTVGIAASSKDSSFSYIPPESDWHLDPKAKYMHITSNNTVYGTQWQTLPDIKRNPVVVDMSSDILSRYVDVKKFGLIYAGAQKNLGPAGITVVIIRDDVLEKCRKDLPTMLCYHTFAESNSLHNTPPTFAIYILDLVVTWIQQQGGVQVIEKNNVEKAALLYDTIDASDGFYRGMAAPDSRSRMNVTFRLAHEALEKDFLQHSQDAGLIGLKGHRALGGFRASLYNAVTLQSVMALTEFMKEFKNSHDNLSHRKD
jgi:phosphoserine aminotransferase